MQTGIRELLDNLPPFLRIPALIVVTLIVGWVLVKLFLALLYWYLRRWDQEIANSVKRHLNGPILFLGPFLLTNLVWHTEITPEETPAFWAKLLVILLIMLLSWFILRIIDLVSGIIRRQFDIREEDNLDERKVLTQLQYIRRVSEIVVFFIALALVLLQFEGVRKIGTGILTSAGVAGIIIGIAAQRSIANLLAGFQIAFTQPIRIDDVVIIEGEWGKIEEITLTYVVVRIWDQRRLVVPLQYFIDHPFQNWTRTTSELIGTVFLYLDYTFPIEAIREELKKYLEGHKLWDKRVAAVQVTDSKPETIEVRLLVSSNNAGNTFDLRCDVREHIIRFIQQNYPAMLPKVRLQLPDGPAEEGGNSGR